jgi:hypothetical protein
MLYCIILSFIFSCNSKIESKNDISKLYSLIEKYDPAKEYEYYKLEQSYLIGDSINNFFSGLNPNEIMADTNFRKGILFILEKKFLYIVTNANKKDAFYVYNASAWWGEHSYIQYALNIFSKISLVEKYQYKMYINKISDVVCIDLIVNETSKYNLVNEEHRKIHNSCIQYVPTKCLEE